MSELSMSEFEQSWAEAPQGDMHKHIEMTQAGVAALRDRLILPEDNRWEIAYGALTMGGAETAVLAEGDPGSGKTAFGNIVVGERERVDIASTDFAETIDGYVLNGVFNPGKLSLNGMAKLYFNEISHLKDTGPLHKYWDGKSLIVNGEAHDLSNASIYATTNFANGRRSKELDDALRSRFGVSVLAGDNAGQIARELQGRDMARSTTSEEVGGLLPPPKARQHIREKLQSQYRLDRQAGAYMASVIENLNETGLVLPISLSDSRIGQGWQQAERARRLVEGASDAEIMIKAEDLSRVAALALGSVALISSAGSAKMQETLGKETRLTPMEKAVLTRRTIAAVAFKTMLEAADIPQRGEEEKTKRFMNRRSYTHSENTDQINDVVLRTISNSNETSQKGDQDDRPRRKLFGRRS